MDDGYGIYAEDPVAILGALLSMQYRKDRGKIAFDHEDLNTVSRAWQRACIAGIGNKAFVEEREKFAKLRDELKNGMSERGQIGVMILEKRDWPKPEIINEAIKALEHAEIRSIH